MKNNQTDNQLHDNESHDMDNFSDDDFFPEKKTLFSRIYKIISRYRHSTIYRWIYSHQTLSITLVIVLGAAIIFFFSIFIYMRLVIQ